MTNRLSGTLVFGGPFHVVDHQRFHLALSESSFKPNLLNPERNAASKEEAPESAASASALIVMSYRPVNPVLS